MPKRAVKTPISPHADYEGAGQGFEPAEFADANQLQSKCLNYPASLSRRPVGIGRTIHASLKHATKILWIVVADQLRDALYR